MFVATRLQAVYEDTNVIQVGDAQVPRWLTNDELKHTIDNPIIKEKDSRHVEMLEVTGTNILTNPLPSELSCILQWTMATSVEGSLDRNKADSRWTGRRSSSCRSSLQSREQSQPCG